MAHDEIAIKVEGVSKTFKLPHEKNTSIKSAVVNFWQRDKGYEVQKALNDISFEVKKGEFFGIVGRNGSGKSTLLKLLAGIYTPSKGNIQINGKLTPFIELGVGFSPDLTGRENVFLNGSLLGFSRKEMEVMYDDIVEFAELERFMDQKLKNYSSGMQVRLAFSIAIRAESDILVLDEILAVGDAAFQKKCLDYFGHLKTTKQTVVFVSHDTESIQRYCDKVAWIDQSEIKLIGSPQDVIPEYLKIFVEKKQSQDLTESDEPPLGIPTTINIDTTTLTIDKARIKNVKGQRLTYINEESNEFLIKFQVRAQKNATGIVPGMIITNELGEFITASNSKWANKASQPRIDKGCTYNIEFTMPNIFEKGRYNISINVVSEDFSTLYAWKNKVLSFECTKRHTTGAKANPDFKVSIEKQ